MTGTLPGQQGPDVDQDAGQRAPAHAVDGTRARIAPEQYGREAEDAGAESGA